MSCETVSDYLWEIIEWYYWWNTCRDVIQGEWISFFLLRLDEETYTYEKHYLLHEKDLYWVYELTSWIEANLEDKLGDIKLKNNELKEKNADYTILEIVNKLFIEILKN